MPTRYRSVVVSSLALGGVWGALAGWWTPRGPSTTSEALLSMVLSLVVGGIAGMVSGSRRSVLLTPLAFAVVFELVRLPTDGPTVDAPQFSTYGLLALAVGRGFHALLTLVPMMLGAALGAGVARRRDAVAPRRWRRLGQAVAGLTALGLVALAVGIAVPASTSQLAGDDSVAELTTLSVDGHELALMIRGSDTSRPVLLFLAGGPGGSELGAMRRHLPELEKEFVVVTLDQRGTGRSYPELDPTDTLTPDRAVADVLAVTSHLRDRFDQDRILLVGQSWGTILGVLAVQEEPTAYSGFVGVGQMVSPLATDTIFYEDTLEWARSEGNQGLVDELESIGRPPYESMLDYETALSYEHEVYPYDHSPNSEGSGGFSENFLVEEYSLVDKVHLLGAFMDTFSVLYPQIQDVDFREDATSLDVPVFFVQGAHEARGRVEPFEEWYAELEAPVKDRVTFDTSGHRPLFEQPDEFVDYLTDTVLGQVS